MIFPKLPRQKTDKTLIPQKKQRHLNDEDNTLKYLGRFKRVPTSLSSDQIQSLCNQFLSGTNERRAQILEEMTYGLIRLVLHIVRFYQNNGVPLIDLAQEALATAVPIALEKYDPTYGVKFTSYIMLWIRHSIVRYIQDHCKIFPYRISIYSQQKRRLVHKIVSRFLLLKGYHPSNDKLWQLVQKSPAAIASRMKPTDLILAIYSDDSIPFDIWYECTNQLPIPTDLPQPNLFYIPHYVNLDPLPAALALPELPSRYNDTYDYEHNGMDPFTILCAKQEFDRFDDALAAIHKYLETVPEIERVIAYERLNFHPKNITQLKPKKNTLLKELGARFGLSRERIRQRQVVLVANLSELTGFTTKQILSLHDIQDDLYEITQSV